MLYKALFYYNQLIVPSVSLSTNTIMSWSFLNELFLIEGIQVFKYLKLFFDGIQYVILGIHNFIYLKTVIGCCVKLNISISYCHSAAGLILNGYSPVHGLVCLICTTSIIANLSTGAPKTSNHKKSSPHPHDEFPIYYFITSKVFILNVGVITYTKLVYLN